MKVIAEASARRGHPRRRHPGHRHHQPARDGRALGPQDRRPRRPRHRLAGPPHRRYCDELKAQGLRRWSSQDRARHRPLFLRHQGQVDAGQCPGLRQRAERGEICFGTIDSWLVYRLTGGRVHITDYSNASRTMLYNIRELRWDEELLPARHPAAILPEVGRHRMSTARPTRRCSSAPTASRSPASPATSRPRCSVRPATQPGMAKNTYGTGSFVLMNTGTEAVFSNERC
jgi:glycerol kinase